MKEEKIPTEELSNIEKQYKTFKPFKEKYINQILIH